MAVGVAILLIALGAGLTWAGAAVGGGILLVLGGVGMLRSLVMRGRRRLRATIALLTTITEMDADLRRTKA